MKLETYLKKLRKAMAKNPREFKFSPHTFYNRDGDLLEVYWDNVSTVAHWMGNGITILVDQEHPKRVVGVQIEKISKILKDRKTP